jgi:hypothetical protein
VQETQCNSAITFSTAALDILPEVSRSVPSALAGKCICAVNIEHGGIPLDSYSLAPTSDESL